MKIVIIAIIGYIDENCEFCGFCLYNNGLLFCREYDIGIICDYTVNQSSSLSANQPSYQSISQSVNHANQPS